MPDHLAACPDCRAEYESNMRLQKRLVARGQAAEGVALVEGVMRRVRQRQLIPEKETIMSKILKHRWGFGLGATAVMATVILIALLSTPKIQAAAAEVMSKGAQAAANLTSIHLRGKVRSEPQDNFSAIMPEQDFVAIELWKQYEPSPSGGWRNRGGWR